MMKRRSGMGAFYFGCHGGALVRPCKSLIGTLDLNCKTDNLSR